MIFSHQVPFNPNHTMKGPYILMPMIDGITAARVRDEIEDRDGECAVYEQNGQWMVAMTITDAIKYNYGEID
jgi:hypothetical protein